MTNAHLRIGTRGSRLALAQTELVVSRLKQAHPGLDVEIVIIQTSGDWLPAHGETRLSEAAGGKGLFAHEIERALLEGRIDCGVHSMKDMPSFLPEGLSVDHALPRSDARDVFICNTAKTLSELPQGATIGTSSLRRQAIIAALRPDLRFAPLRGNVPTRLDKLDQGQVDATILAMAGLKRLGLDHRATSILAPEDMLPACGQGIVGVERRTNDDATKALLDPIHDRTAGLCLAAERAALKILGGTCRTPVSAYATLSADNRLDLRGLVAAPDGTGCVRAAAAGQVNTVQDAERLGEEVGAILRRDAPPGILEEIEAA